MSCVCVGPANGIWSQSPPPDPLSLPLACFEIHESGPSRLVSAGQPTSTYVQYLCTVPLFRTLAYLAHACQLTTTLALPYAHKTPC